jgi:hypothetical protein
VSNGDVPEPAQIYKRTKEEGGKRLARPLLEVASTAVAAGFDVATGAVALALVETQLMHLRSASDSSSSSSDAVSSSPRTSSSRSQASRAAARALA